MNRTLAATAFLTGFLAVAIGAFGAHGLKPYMNSYSLEIFEKASRYHFYHTFALIALALFPNNKLKTAAVICFITGVLLFSGSLYILALKDFFNINAGKPLVLMTPVGGLLLLSGWIFSFFSVIKNIRQ
jgi:uncharacterized membrane protein YgdD (TMEM256/DUF423 family)